MKMLLLLLIVCFSMQAMAKDFETDIVQTSKGPLTLTFIAHGSLMLNWNGLTIHIDPVMMYADYQQLPDADLILITHHHGDHLSPEAVDAIGKANTEIIISESCLESQQGRVMKNGDQITAQGVVIEAVPAYNLKHKRSNGEPYHPKGIGNGYVLTLGDKRVYIAGDTEDVPEMADLENIDIAFLPMNLPYTMSPEMAAHAWQMVKSDVLYPYHYGETDVNELKALLKDASCEIRIRQLQ